MKAARWSGNIYSGIALVLCFGILIDWLVGWQAYCWLRWQIAGLMYAYGLTIGAVALLVVLWDRKVAAYILLPALFPALWPVVEGIVGFHPNCAVPGI